MNIISISKLTKNYKTVTAVDDLTLNIPRGAVYGLAGLNGAGKTTLFKVVTGLIKKFEGSVEVAGIKWGGKGYREKFAFLPERFTPHRCLTGWEYLSFMQKLRGARPDREKVLRLCDSFGFDAGLLDKKNALYSKGTAQKLGIIQAACAPADLLVMDEPMSGLDPLARALFRTVITGPDCAGRSVLLSTHILYDIDTLCTHMGILHRGRLLFSGTTAGLKERHNTGDLEKAFLMEIGAV